MKHLLTLHALFRSSSLPMGQNLDHLPYNPDDNGDGLIGVADLQGLLANYGNEFCWRSVLCTWRGNGRGRGTNKA